MDTSVVNAGSVFKSIYEQTQGIGDLVAYFAFMMGIIFVVSGLYRFRQMGDYHHMMSQPLDLRGPLGKILVGTALIATPQMLREFTVTFLGDLSSAEYRALQWHPAESKLSLFDEAMNTTLSLVRLLGLIAFVRGLIMLASLGDQSQQNSVGKAMLHLVGGVCAVNINVTVKIILNTLNLG